MALDASILPMFLAASAVLLVTPGPDTAFITATGIAQGRRMAAFGAAGVSLSMFSHSIFAAAGLSALLSASAPAFDLVRFAGSAYLIWLAFSTIRTGRAVSPAQTTRSTDLESFKRGYLTNLLNPKVILFISLFLVQFVSKGHGPFFMQVISLGAVLAVLAFAFFLLLGQAAGSLGRLLIDSDTCKAILPKVLAAVFLLLAIRLLFMTRPM